MFLSEKSRETSIKIDHNDFKISAGFHFSYETFEVTKCYINKAMSKILDYKNYEL